MLIDVACQNEPPAPIQNWWGCRTISTIDVHWSLIGSGKMIANAGHCWTLLDNFRNRNMCTIRMSNLLLGSFLVSHGFSFPPCAYPKAKRALLHQAKWTTVQGRENWHRLRSSNRWYQRCTNVVPTWWLQQYSVWLWKKRLPSLARLASEVTGPQHDILTLRH